MAVSINPFDLLKVLQEHRKQSREQVITWLNGVQADARELSEIWTKLAAGLDPDQSTKDDTPHFFGGQLAVHARLHEFYKSASLAINGRLRDDYWSTFIDHLARVLDGRARTRKEAEKIVQLVRQEKNIVLLSTTDTSQAFSSMQAAAATLQEELAALDVLIQTIKAAPKAVK